MDAKKFGVLWYLAVAHGPAKGTGLGLQLPTAYDRSNSYLTIPKNDYIVAEKNFCFHRENTLREERNNVRIYAGLSDGHRPDR